MSNFFSGLKIVLIVLSHVSISDSKLFDKQAIETLYFLYSLFLKLFYSDILPYLCKSLM